MHEMCEEICLRWARACIVMMVIAAKENTNFNNLDSSFLEAIEKN